jgi:predicted DNA-binding antitoxin AbrB/MazE fold protein
MATIHATYEAGVFRPHSPVNLPDRCEVEFEPKLITPPDNDKALDDVYGVLAERYETGEKDVAARHNEHQPPPR